MPRTSIADLVGQAQLLAASGQADAAAALYADWAAQEPDHPALHAVLFNHGVLLSARPSC